MRIIPCGSALILFLTIVLTCCDGIDSIKRVWLVRHGMRQDERNKGKEAAKENWVNEGCPPRGYEDETPLSDEGLKQAFDTGIRLRDKGARIHRVISSPYYRCLQTSQGIVDAYNFYDPPPIQIEPGFAECARYCKCGYPWVFMSTPDASKYMDEKGRKMFTAIDTRYKAFYQREEIFPAESNLDVFRRVTLTLDHLLNTDTSSGDLLIVSHGLLLCLTRAYFHGTNLYTETCSISRYDLQNGKWVETCVGEISHLDNDIGHLWDSDRSKWVDDARTERWEYSKQIYENAEALKAQFRREGKIKQ